jgi:hypothetical protein
MSEAGKSSPGSAEFAAFRKDLELTKGINFFSRVEDVPPGIEGVKRVAIISAREYSFDISAGLQCLLGLPFNLFSADRDIRQSQSFF